MKGEQQLCQCLMTVAHIMQQQGLWQDIPPNAAVFNSVAPFCMDTMLPQEWLQWVLLPQLQRLIDERAPLPKKFAITPYYEETLDADLRGRGLLLNQLKLLDHFFKDQEG